MEKKALVIISFGTSHPDALSSIESLEQRLKTELPEYDCFRCFTSRTIIRKLKQKQNKDIPSPPEIMKYLAEAGYQDVVCQTLHIIPGIEYEKMKEELLSFRQAFRTLTIGKPLLLSESDYRTCCQAVLSHCPALGKHDALLLMGHGTEHFANAAYCQLENTFRYTGHPNILVGTVEGFPGISDFLPVLKASAVRRLYLMPFMIVSGDHAKNDLAGSQKDSWKSILEQEGYSVIPLLTGLGEWEEIGTLVIRHLKEATPNAV